MAPPCSVPKFLTGSIPARWYGLRVPLRVSIVVGFLLCIYLVYHARPTHRDPFGEQDTVVVHGKTVNGRPKPTYPLVPFPSSPMRACPTTTETTTDLEECVHPRNPWLAAVICAMDDFEHRMRIRSTWMRLFRDVPFDGRFVVSNPGPRWTEAVAMENRTFGDLIVLEHLHEDDITANTVKTLEFYRWLVKSGRKYEFVSKMDTDLWLNARGFWDRFLVPRMATINVVDVGRNQSIVTETVQKSTVSRTIIGELYYSRKQRLVFPHGGMYTTTWDILEELVTLQDKYHVVTGEDMAVSLLLSKGSQKANFVNFRGSEKFDYDDDDSRGDTAWARAETHPDATQHALTGFWPVAVHQLKRKRDWFKVAGCFDEGGIKEAPRDEGKGRAPPLSVRWFDFWHRLGMTRRYETRFETIPEALWAREGGNWTCGGVWNMGASREGYSGEALGSQ
ncbi:hypothetical protein CMUS01_08113 [Colletotrichum musicola]|uniref:Hexosyltransferase n=1 Tax=Colletotrichum musicola TaxID=2175873 RepID=A0A8H6KE04_9PEZI|nr:hypothetical protein CMUS01_08113 [Colletotrichum musicola]